MSARHNPYAAPAGDGEDDAPASEDVADALATPGQRLLGALVDAVFVIGVCLLIGALIWDDYLLRPLTTTFYISLSRLAVPLLIPMSLQWLLISQNGQSLGKRLVGTRVVRLRGSHAGFRYGVFLRAWVPWGLSSFAAFLLPIAAQILPLIDALFVFRADRRTLRDHVAGTKVIQVRR